MSLVLNITKCLISRFCLRFTFLFATYFLCEHFVSLHVMVLGNSFCSSLVIILHFIMDLICEYKDQILFYLN